MLFHFFCVKVIFTQWEATPEMFTFVRPAAIYQQMVRRPILKMPILSKHLQNTTRAQYIA